MKVRNAVAIGLCVMMCFCFIASAEKITDAAGDVYHWTQTGTAWSWRANIADKPNIDIKEISYAISDDKITLSMKVYGSIQTSDKVGYYLWYNSTDTVYMLSYMNGEGTGFGVKGMNFTSEQNVIVSGDTLSVVLDVLGDTSKVELWGWAVEYTTSFGDQTNEWWGDWAPNDRFIGGVVDDDTDDETGDNGTGDDGTDETDDGGESQPSTPGFEVLAVLAACGVAFILLRKRR
jgi:hypothetical protein